ncbi:MAG: hypothetical protein J6Y85_05770 [Alphaproteobacteria bacterium]|nr:hypothetical protein [Alphaproteobacteria bacterium]
MAKEKLALSDFLATQTVAFASGVENTKEQIKNVNGLPICKSGAVIAAAPMVLKIKKEKVSAK